MWGQFKGVKGEGYHLMPVAAITATRLWPGDCFGRLMSCLKHAGMQNGKVLQGKRKGEKKIRHYANRFYQYLEKMLQESTPHLMGLNVEEVKEDYGLSWSLRRGVTTHAQNQGVEQNVIEGNNRRRKEEKARGGNPHLTMMD